jgi:hypothetical protein
MTPITYYTVLIGKRSCTVTYATSPAYEVQALTGTFSDPGEASQEIKRRLQKHLEYLAPGVFQRKVYNLAQRYQQDLINLATWNQCSQPTQMRKSPMSLTNEQYFNNLPVNGLEAAEDYLEQDLKILQNNNLPQADTVAGLLTVRTLLEDESEEEGQP